MGNKQPATLVKIRSPTPTSYYIYSEKENLFVPLTENHLSRASPGYTTLNEKARQREFDAFIKRSKIIQTFKLSDCLPNAPPKPRLKRLTLEERSAAVQGFLSASAICESPKLGYLLLADALCGLHCTALRKADPSFSPTIAIRSNSPKIRSILEEFVKSIVRLSHWKSKKVKICRKAILDYQVAPDELQKHIQDFSQVKCKVPGYKKLRFPMEYADTIVLMIGADNSQFREAAPHLNNTAVVLLNSGSGDLTPTKLSSSDIAAYDPEVVHQLTVNRKAISALLGWWWSVFDSEDAWAQWIVQKARASFGKPDSRYIRVELDPKKLRDAIRYQVLLSFFDQLEAYGFVTAEELDLYRQGAKNVFDPVPQEPVIHRRAEDPEVFLRIMKELVSSKCDSIIPEGERFVKKDKPLGAWRTISGERYLVMLEDTWAKAYKKEVLARKDLDASFLLAENWEGKLQKIFSEGRKIKKASSGYRYRYDLYGNNTRDNTYVIAIPAQLLES